MNPRERYYLTPPGQTDLREIHAVSSWETETGETGTNRCVCLVEKEWAENLLVALRSGRTTEHEIQEKGWRSALGIQQ